MGGKLNNTKIVPLTEEQKQDWSSAIAKMDDTFLPALAWQGDEDNRKRVFVASFDGTWNDRDDLKDGELPTNPAVLEKQLSKLYDGKNLDGNYYHGVGTRENAVLKVLNGMTGEGSEDRAEQAFKDFQKKAQEWLKEDPNAQIHVFAMGFSRGAASARHFLNLVDERGVPTNEGRVIMVEDPYSSNPTERAQTYHVYDAYLREPGTVTSSALLYDTVATGQENVLKLGIPSSTHYVVHLTSQDESRSTFPLTDIDGKAPTRADAARFMTLSLPGVHSDIGGGYSEGVAKLGRYLGEQTLYRLGFDVPPGQVPMEAFAEGIHQHVTMASPEDYSEQAVDAVSRRTRHVDNEPMSEAEQDAILEANRKAAVAAGLRYLEGVENGTAPKDPWGLENHGIALTPGKDGTMDVYLTNPKVVQFDEKAGTISVYGEVVRKLSEEDYSRLEAGEQFVEMYSVIPKHVAAQETQTALSQTPPAPASAPAQEALSPTAEAPQAEGATMVR
jgi:hypothetical protein